ncbi:MAG TPA: hypothetical protein DD415_02855 [Clostridiales bacterium]|nr:hypothetical protein [Clostridiales bacterium]
MSNNTKRRGFSPILAFILGIIFGIIILVGTIVAAVFVALNYKIDNIGANKDEDGNYVFINGDPDNGGVGTLLDLIKKVGALAGDYQSLSVGEVENLLPVASGITEKLREALSQYVTIDAEELKAVKFGEFGDYVQGKVMDIRPAALIDSFGGGLPDNEIIDLILNGKESDYVENGESLYPVYYDAYTAADGGFLRKPDGARLAADKEQYLAEKGEEYRLYFYGYGDNNYVTYKDEDNYVFSPVESMLYAAHTSCAALSGNYYYDGENKIEVTPVTIGSFSDGSAFDALYDVPVTELVTDADGVTQKILGGISVGDLMNGTVDFGEVIDGLEISDFIDVELTRVDGRLELTSSDIILSYFVYGITDIVERDGVITGVYHPVGGEAINCFIEELDGKINCVRLGDGTEITGTGLNTVSDRVGGVTSDLKIGAIMDVEDNKLLKAIENSTIESLPADIANLSVNELYAEDIYGREIYLAEKFDAALLYYSEIDGGYKLVGNLTAEQFGEGTFYTYGAATATWKLLLYSGGVEQTYSVNNLTALITNVTANTQNTTMSELTEAGILTLTPEQLAVKFNGKPVGEMTLVSVIDAFINLLSSMPQNS